MSKIYGCPPPNGYSFRTFNEPSVTHRLKRFEWLDPALLSNHFSLNTNTYTTMSSEATGLGQLRAIDATFDFDTLIAQRKALDKPLPKAELDGKVADWMNMTVNFGRYKGQGKTNKDIFIISPSYFKFLLKNARNFYADEVQVWDYIENKCFPKDEAKIAEKKEAAKKRKAEAKAEAKSTAASGTSTATSWGPPIPQASGLVASAAPAAQKPAAAPTAQAQAQHLPEPEEGEEEEEPEEEPEEQPKKGAKRGRSGGRR